MKIRRVLYFPNCYSYYYFDEECMCTSRGFCTFKIIIHVIILVSNACALQDGCILSKFLNHVIILMRNACAVQEGSVLSKLFMSFW